MATTRPDRAGGGRLAPRAARRSRASLQARVERLWARAVFVLQCGFAAGLAWAVAHYVLGHETPFFAPVAAMLTLGQSYGQRLTRALEVTVGVTVGVFCGDLFVHAFGSGAWQVGVVVVVAMSLAVLLGAGTMMVTQAGIQSAVVITLVAQPGEDGVAVARWVDALVGGAIALAVATFVPAAPVRKPRQQAATVARELADVLRDVSRALTGRDLPLARAALTRARTSEAMLTQLRTLSAEGIDVVRYSPFLRQERSGVLAVASLVEPLDRAARNVRVLARRAQVAVLDREVVPDSYAEAVASLGVVTGDIASGLQERRLLPDNARQALADVSAAARVAARHTSLSAEVIRAQVTSVVVDLLMLTGLSYEQAREVARQETDAEEDR